jgi:hypothetical protein
MMSSKTRAPKIHRSLWRGSAVVLAMAVGLFSLPAQADTGNDIAARNAVVWNTLGKNENDSMPLGNGDLAANVWTEENGDLVILLAKADALNEDGDLLKLGRLRVHFETSPFSGSYAQTLSIADGSIVIKDGKTEIRVWIDANNPAMHTEIHLATPTKVRATVELWRTGSGNSAKASRADTVLPAGAGALTWYHRNESSSYPDLMRQEHLESLLPKYPDPFLGRMFGATLIGQGFAAVDDTHLVSDRAQQDYRLDVLALSQERGSAEDWGANLKALVPKANPANLEQAWSAHRTWWREFWGRSWIDVSGSDQARAVSQGYAMQRFMMAASSRGAYPVKFNGGLFTVGHNPVKAEKPTVEDHDPDYRRWGSNYWNQNNRLLYWPLVTTGDYDLVKPWFDMYLNALPMAKDRTRIYTDHEGAALQETIFYFGIPRLQDFGRNNPTKVMQSSWQRYHIQGTLEVIAEMLDYYQYSGDSGFMKTSIVPFADAIVTYYDLHWPRDKNGKIQMSPSQSLETYQLTAVNPTPDIAGLKSILPRLLALPADATTTAQRSRWADVLADLPPIPTGTTTAEGKTPPFGAGDKAGKPIILPAERYGSTGNGENPELYVAFPYRLYGVGKPDLELARNTFAARKFPQATCWGQDGTQSAVLGLTDVAQKAVTSEFTNYGEQRFKWFWKAAHDWIPDLDNGGSGMITLQLMLIQTDDKRIQLTPAWPADWTADFKVRAPYNTTITGHVERGKLTGLEVSPKERMKDVVIVPVASATSP